MGIQAASPKENGQNFRSPQEERGMIRSTWTKLFHVPEVQLSTSMVQQFRTEGSYRTWFSNIVSW